MDKDWMHSWIKVNLLKVRVFPVCFFTLDFKILHVQKFILFLSGN